MLFLIPNGKSVRYEQLRLLLKKQKQNLRIVLVLIWKKHFRLGSYPRHL